ncbi:MAG: hypothetical protein PHU68_03310 [Paludibacter sp.]|nr:hypothetical protein [Paludibacter sp.]
METKFATIEQRFDTTNHSIITSKKKSPLIGILALAAGVASAVLVPLVNTEGGAGGALLIVLAIGFIIWGILATFIRRRFYLHVPSNSKILFKDVFFEAEHYLKINKIVENGSYLDLAKIPQTIDKGVKLRVAYTAGKTICYVQLLKYVPYEYEVQSEAIELTADQTAAIFNALKL